MLLYPELINLFYRSIDEEKGLIITPLTVYLEELNG